jgi:BirA family biotin operon repressor/biotin-[acetyl-CoA-carboxylase] ligase
MSSVPIEQWPAALERALASCAHLRRAKVLAETDSTQDAARRMNAAPGDVITTWRQTAGRGRLGRAWADTADLGLACSFVIPRRDPQWLSIACAVGAARAAESLLGRTIGIKWPNDVVVPAAAESREHSTSQPWRKLAGVLVEQNDAIAIVGVGMNIGQNREDWPAELRGKAISLRALGANVDRIDALAALVRAMDAALELSDAKLEEKFAARDVLTGRRAVLRCGQEEFLGVIRSIRPLEGIVLQTSSGERLLPAAAASITQVLPD